MNIAVTGHTSGIGLALFDKFTQSGHTVLGFSRANGYDIGSGSLDSILEQSQHFDMFINNAFHSTGQNRLLEELLILWQGTDKYIINISSNIVNVTVPLSDEANNYKLAKVLSNQIVNDYQGSVNILNVLPDLVKTNFYLGGSLLESGMDANYVAKTIINNIKPGVSELIIQHPDWL
jgi:short-subunit dehydrogenase